MARGNFLRRMRSRIRALVGFAIAAWCIAPACAIAQEPRPEAAVKSAFVYNFGKFVDWPAERGGDGPFAVCVLGQPDAFQEAVMALAGRTVQRRPVVSRRLQRADEAFGCQILVIGQSQSRRVESVLHALQGQAVLTVSDIEGFAASGGMLGLVTVAARVTFEVNLGAAQRAGLRLSPQLIALGHRVDEAPVAGARK